MDRGLEHEDRIKEVEMVGVVSEKGVAVVVYESCLTLRHHGL